jgi:hypothetical protein
MDQEPAGLDSKNARVLAADNGPSVSAEGCAVEKIDGVARVAIVVEEEDDRPADPKRISATAQYDTDFTCVGPYQSTRRIKSHEIDERLEQRFVVLLAGVAHHQIDRHIGEIRLPPRTLRGQRIVDVGDRHDAREKIGFPAAGRVSASGRGPVMLERHDDS